MIEKIIILSAGFLPSFVWLLFYLRKDSHPESNYLVLRIFLAGALSGVAAIFLEKWFQSGWGFLKFAVIGLPVFLVSGFIEEIVKFLAVKIGLLKTSEPDEPIDWVLFMIISALGFAALENVLVLSSQVSISSVKAVEVMLWRFVSATFLHGLCSGVIGYLWFLSKSKQKRAYLILGILAISCLHSFYNWSIMSLQGADKFLLPLAIIMALWLTISFAIKRLKK